MRIKVVYPRKVVGGRMTSLDDPEMKSGPRLKMMVMEMGHELVRRDPDVIINYGTTNSMEHPKIINRPEFVSVSSHKFSANRVMSDAGVPIPKFAEGGEEFRRLRGKIIFKPFHGRCSRGKEVFESVNEVPMSPRFALGFFQEFKDIAEEWRVIHVDGEYPGLFLKVGGRGVLRSARFGWYYQRKWKFFEENREKYKRLKNLAKRAVESLNLDFGGVDIGIDREGNYWVFEVNSATFIRNSEARKIVRMAERA
ncbi:MAG: ATP-grasp domain-containing protein [Candidatus Helarchaeales archaeon]